MHTHVHLHSILIHTHMHNILSHTYKYSILIMYACTCALIYTYIHTYAWMHSQNPYKYAHSLTHTILTNTSTQMHSTLSHMCACTCAHILRCTLIHTCTESLHMHTHSHSILTHTCTPSFHYTIHIHTEKHILHTCSCSCALTYT